MASCPSREDRIFVLYIPRQILLVDEPRDYGVLPPSNMVELGHTAVDEDDFGYDLCI